MKYTKGKWSVKKLNIGIQIVAPSDVSRSSKMTWPIAKIIEVGNYDEAESNAKLISKAPEMYEVLIEEKENLNNDLDNMISSDYNVHARKILENRIKRIESILNKIEL